MLMSSQEGDSMHTIVQANAHTSAAKFIPNERCQVFVHTVFILIVTHGSPSWDNPEQAVRTWLIYAASV